MNTGQEDQVRAWYIGSDRIQTIYECWTCECECECWTPRLGVVLPGTPPQGLRFFFSATGWLVHHHYQCHQFFEGHQCHQFHQCLQSHQRHKCFLSINVFFSETIWTVGVTYQSPHKKNHHHWNHHYHQESHQQPHHQHHWLHQRGTHCPKSSFSNYNCSDVLNQN